MTEQPHGAPEKPGRRPRRVVRWLAALALVVAAVATLAAVATAPQGRRERGDPPDGEAARVPVLVAEARTEDVPVYLHGVGSALAFRTVTVRSQVDGKLASVAFEEGQDVRKGDVLARIDPVTYQAELDQAKAKLAQDQSLLANAKVDLERYTRLARTDYATKQQADTQQATVAQLQAQIAWDQAAVESAQAYVDYCTITSPIDGRTGFRLVDAGNIIHAADATGIVVITQLRPISVVFTLPETDLGQVNEGMAKGPLPAMALLGASATPVEEGTLAVVDNQVDPTTGTIRLKATFPNTSLQLWPGQFVNIDLLVETRHDALVVPAAAAQQGPDGTYVFVVEDGKVRMQTVQIVQEDALIAVIGKGLASGQTVVTSGFGRLKEGTEVRIDRAPPEKAPDGGS
jgi:multidrug efflux system membrane fusion protein